MSSFFVRIRRCKHGWCVAEFVEDYEVQWFELSRMVVQYEFILREPRSVSACGMYG
jgi:hypothetical protein